MATIVYYVLHLYIHGSQVSCTYPFTLTQLTKTIHNELDPYELVYFSSPYTRGWLSASLSHTLQTYCLPAMSPRFRFNM